MDKSGLQYTIALFDLEFIEYDRLCGCVVLLYVRKQHDHVFTALILDSPTVHSLLQAVRTADVLLTIDYYIQGGSKTKLLYCDRYFRG